MEIPTTKESKELGLSFLDEGTKVIVETRNTTYTIEKRKDGLYISGHPEICPEPRKVRAMGAGRTGVGWSKWVIKEGEGMVVVLDEQDDSGLNKQFDTSGVQSFRID